MWLSLAIFFCLQIYCNRILAQTANIYPNPTGSGFAALDIRILNPCLSPSPGRAMEPLYSSSVNTPHQILKVDRRVQKIFHKEGFWFVENFLTWLKKCCIYFLTQSKTKSYMLKLTKKVKILKHFVYMRYTLYVCQFAHFSIRTYGVNQEFRFGGGFLVTSKESSNPFFFRKWPFLLHTCATCYQNPVFFSRAGSYPY